MKWGLQHVKVTLEESESGETVVIEQSSDGRVTCERGKAGKREQAANAAPPTSRQRKAEAPAEGPKPTKTEERKRGVEARKAEDRPKQPEGKPGKTEDKRSKTEHKAATPPSSKKPRSKPKPAPARTRHRYSLEWAPVVDHEYTGFAARSDAGQFKVLITKGSQWALFFEQKDTWPKNLGCFRKVNKAKERAQELHDAGWPESEFGPITAGQVARACPAPGRDDEHTEEEPEMKNTPKPAPKRASKPTPVVEEEPTSTPKPTSAVEEPLAAPKPEPKGSSKTEAEMDKELLGSLTSKLENMLDEDDDD